jgi:hypothetical protein
MNKIHEVESKGIKNKILSLVVDGTSYKIDLAKESEKLNKATEGQLTDFVISPSGYGIHWPQIDEDLAIDPMIGIEHEFPKWKVAEEFTGYITKKDEQ